MAASKPRGKRKLAAILVADAVSYSALMEADEEGTLKMLMGCRSKIDSLVSAHAGRIFGTAGDSVIAEFASIVEAVRCAIEVQQTIEELNKHGSQAANQRMNFRVGVHLGDVIVRNGNLFGSAVNIAARLEGLAEPGSIWVSSAVRDEVWSKIPSTFVNVGEHKLKNIRVPIQAYRLRGSIDETVPYLTREMASVDRPNHPVVLVRYSLEEMSIDATIRTKINVVFKNNGSKSAVLNKITTKRKASVTAHDCPRRGHNMFFPEWDYDFDVEDDEEISGHHYLVPNEVDTFDVIFGRAKGDRRLTVYKIDMNFVFDEQEEPIVIDDLMIKIAGPGTALGYHTIGISKQEWCECMLENIKKFDAIGYDYRRHIRPDALEDIVKVAAGQSVN